MKVLKVAADGCRGTAANTSNVDDGTTRHSFHVSGCVQSTVLKRSSAVHCAAACCCAPNMSGMSHVGCLVFEGLRRVQFSVFHVHARALVFPQAEAHNAFAVICLPTRGCTPYI